MNGVFQPCVCLFSRGGRGKIVGTPPPSQQLCCLFWGCLWGLCGTSIGTQNTGRNSAGTLYRLPSTSLIRSFISTPNRCGPRTSTSPGRCHHDDFMPHPSLPAPCGLKVQHPPGGTSLKAACLSSFLPRHSLQGTDISFSTEALSTMLGPWRRA